MTRTKFALGGSAIAATLLIATGPSFAYTRHPATPAEIRQTDDLNAQSLAAARAGTEPTQLTTDRRMAESPDNATNATNTPETSPATPNSSMPDTNMPDAIHPTPSNPPPGAETTNTPGATQ